MTCYDPSGNIIIIGKKDIERIARLQHHRNKLQSKVTKAETHKKRYTLKKALKRMNETIKNLVDDMHKKITKFLCDNYKYIYIPKLNFHNIPKLNKKHKAKLVAYRHCEFVERLKNKTREHEQCKIIEVNEAYTCINTSSCKAETCSNCGAIDRHLRNKDEYKCTHCNNYILRDINGAVNIMLRYLSKRALIEFSIENSTNALSPTPCGLDQKI